MSVCVRSRVQEWQKMEGGYEDSDGAMRDRFGRNVVLYYVPKYRTDHKHDRLHTDHLLKRMSLYALSFETPFVRP